MLWRLLLLLILASPAFGQVLPRYEEKVLQPSTTCTTAASPCTGTVTTGLNFIRHGYCLLNVTAISGTSPTIDVYLQGSPDTGATYCDYARFSQVATSVGKSVLSLMMTRAGGFVNEFSTTSHACQDGGSALTAGSSYQGIFGDRLRVKAVTAGTSGSATFTVTCQLAGG